MFSAMVDALDEHFNHRPGSSSSSASLAHVTGTVPPVAEEVRQRTVCMPSLMRFVVALAWNGSDAVVMVH